MLIGQSFEATSGRRFNGKTLEKRLSCHNGKREMLISRRGIFGKTIYSQRLDYSVPELCMAGFYLSEGVLFAAQSSIHLYCLQPVIGDDDVE